MKKSLAIWSPRPDAQEVVRLSDDISIYPLPVMTVTTLPLNVGQQQAFHSADTCLFTSYNAVTALASSINVGEWSGKQVLAIGRRTAMALNNVGINVDLVANPPFTSESLLAMPAFQAMSINHVVLCCGRGGRRLLTSHLSQRAKKFERIECYQRNKTKLTAKVMVEFTAEHQINGVIISSCEIADAVIENLSRAQVNYQHWTAFVFSQRIAEHIKSQGFSEVIVAPQSEQQSLNQAVVAWWEIR